MVYQEGEGINLAFYLINKFINRKFVLSGTRKKYSEISGEKLLKLLQEEMDSMLILYKYMTKVKEYTDRKGIPHFEMKLIGKASAMNRYNPLDVQFEIKTEVPNK